jgi:Rv0078B-related antitoxin
MKPIRDPAVMARVKTTFELYELAEAMMRQNLRRRFPQESEEQIEARVVAWLHDRPGESISDASWPFRVRRVFP